MRLLRPYFMHRLGEIRDSGLENPNYHASGLILLTKEITLWNTVYVEWAIEPLKRKGLQSNTSLVSNFPL
ncbi:hypothetical protein CLB51_24585 [Salmonella enterica]|nr:hypothetical protein [Salmonella enterica]EBZ4888515.1 hypothetical protein [Salmonella enterica subsp. enterica serovar Bredeney]EDR9399205.1 Tn3 family transposase [Salmonella enterica subsp. enterica]EDT6893260.1 Tn3 family transposase [Salmonella enterica subsp. enterica serovar Javiana]EDX5193541.1 Tn3 family transposase [Salmonella enterica subsp. enterica serovar Glostrup]EHW1129245.1 Tn3 family transposase [Salmonella enterica subsp. enterica serovar Kinondoni]HCM6292793.1 Tn3 fami